MIKSVVSAVGDRQSGGWARVRGLGMVEEESKKPKQQQPTETKIELL